MVEVDDAVVKVEPNDRLRGAVFPGSMRDLSLAQNIERGAGVPFKTTPQEGDTCKDLADPNRFCRDH